MADSTGLPTVIRNAAVALPEGLRRVDIGMRSGKIDRIGEALDGYQTQIDATGYTVIPGMIDVHTHGAMNVDAGSASVEDFHTLSAYYASEGVTGFVPTVISDAQSPHARSAAADFGGARRCAQR